MTNRKDIYDTIRTKLEAVGFWFEKEQRPHMQYRKEPELVFIHPQLHKKCKEIGYKTSAQKYYLKPLTDDYDSEIGLVTGTTSALYTAGIFHRPNAIDSFHNSPAWCNRVDDNAIDILLEDIDTFIKSPGRVTRNKSSTYLLTWNPTKLKWTQIDEDINQIQRLGYYERRWSCGNTKTINYGDRIFLMRLGLEPKGIFGSGFAKSSFYEGPHWDQSPGKTANYIDIEFDFLINSDTDKIFDANYLKQVDTSNLQRWFPHQSGISIKPEIVDTLESSWFSFINNENNFSRNDFNHEEIINYHNDTFLEGKSKGVILNRIERNPHARKACLAYHGYSCHICDFNFEEVFGELGRGFIHVHHINPLSTIKREFNVNPKLDLIPLCPNCHAMIHLRTPAFTIEEVKQIRKI